MKHVYAPANSAEAHMLAHLLEQNGIAAHIHGEALQGGVGELPAGGLLQIMVADEDYERARALIMAWERTAVSAASEDAVKPRVPIWMGLIVFALGVSGGWMLRSASEWNAIPVDAAEERLDLNHDGQDDTTYFYRVGARHAHKASFDTNFDGATDITDYYDGEGVTTRRESDDNFDGFIESRTYYQSGVATRTEVDRNRNGVPDLLLHYRYGVLSREEIHDNRTGRVARVNFYENSLVTRSETDLDGDGVFEIVRSYDERGEIASTETR